MGQPGSAFRGKNRGTQSMFDALSIIFKLVMANLMFTEKENLNAPALAHEFDLLRHPLRPCK